MSDLRLPPGPWEVDFARGEILDGQGRRIVSVVGYHPDRALSQQAALKLMGGSADLKASGDHLMVALADAPELLACEDPVKREYRRTVIDQFKKALLDSTLDTSKGLRR